MVIAIKNIGPNIPHLSVTITLLITFHNICNSHLNFNARLSVRENNISIIRPGFLWKDTYKSNAWHLVKNLRTICLFYSLFSDIFFRWKYFDTWRFNALYITFTRIHTHTHTGRCNIIILQQSAVSRICRLCCSRGPTTTTTNHILLLLLFYPSKLNSDLLAIPAVIRFTDRFSFSYIISVLPRTRRGTTPSLPFIALRLGT